MMLATSTRAPFLAMKTPEPRPGVPFGIVGRPQEALLARRERQRLALVPDMVAGGHDIGAGRNRLAKDLLGDAEAAGGVLAVDDDEIEPEIGDQAGQLLPHRRAPGSCRPCRRGREVSCVLLYRRARSGATRSRSGFPE